MLPRHRNKTAMVKLATPKQGNLTKAVILLEMQKSERDALPDNVTIRCTYKGRARSGQHGEKIKDVLVKG